MPAKQKRVKSKTNRSLWPSLLSLLLCLWVSACSQTGDKPQDDMASANISPYNHTGDYIHQLYIDGAWGGNSYAYGGGGSFVCCVVYPRKWRAGLTAKVKWTTSSSNPNATEEEGSPTWHEKIVPIEKYDKPGTTLNVHFLPNNEVRLIITNMSAGHPDYPGPQPPEAPADWPPWQHPGESASAKSEASDQGKEHLPPPPMPASNKEKE